MAGAGRTAWMRYLAVVLCTAVLFGCAAGAATTHRDPQTLVALVRTDAGTLNPLYAQTTDDAVYQSLVFDQLTTYGPDYAPRPALATSWTHTPDGLHWIVDLRRNVTWSDGVPFTSKDVVFSYKTMLDPKVAFNQTGVIDFIKSIEGQGPYRVRFDLTHTSATFIINSLELAILPEHILGKIPGDRQRFSPLGEHPVGTGPYMLEHWQHDSEAVFVRNPHYWAGEPHIPRIDFRVIFNDQAEVEALENGTADLIDDLGFTGYKRIKSEAPHIKLLTFASLYNDTAEVNLHRPGLSDVVVRQAMMYGYDRDALIRGFFDGQVSQATNIVPIGLTRWYNPHVKVYPYDPAKARAMLDADGWKLGADGVRAKNGTRLSFEILINQGSPFVIDQTIAFQADMETIGIKIAVRQLDFPSLVSRTYKEQYDLIADARGGTFDPDWTTVLSSKQAPPAGGNTTGFNNPTIDRDLRLGQETLDDVKRKRYYDEMQRILAEQLPMLWQYGRFAGAAHSARLILDPKTTLQSPLMWYNVADWKLEP